MRFGRVVEASRGVAATSRRGAKLELLAGLLRELGAAEAPIVIPWLSGALRQGRGGIGYAALREASAPPAREAALTAAEVDLAIQSIFDAKGAGSARRRKELLASLLARATEAEQDFLRRLLTGELRQGALEGLMLEAVARAASVPAEGVRRAAMLAGDLVPVAQAVFEEGERGLERFRIQLLRPVQPMLAQAAEGVEEALAELGEAAFEYKLDGARIQAHRSGGDVVVFSRNLNDVTPAVPEVVEAVLALPERELILDGEVIALAAGGRPLPFQTTMRRFGRKLDVERMRGELPLTPFWFDLLYCAGGSLVDEPQARRFSELARLAPEERLTPRLATADPARALEFTRGALAAGHEGVMAKSLCAPYAAGKRGQSWLKIKQPRTLDLAVLAAERVTTVGAHLGESGQRLLALSAGELAELFGDGGFLNIHLMP